MTTLPTPKVGMFVKLHNSDYMVFKVWTDKNGCYRFSASSVDCWEKVKGYYWIPSVVTVLTTEEIAKYNKPADRKSVLAQAAEEHIEEGKVVDLIPGSRFAKSELQGAGTRMACTEYNFSIFWEDMPNKPMIVTYGPWCIFDDAHHVIGYNHSKYCCWAS